LPNASSSGFTCTNVREMERGNTIIKRRIISQT
jgi:hypothetical protein